jgi:hypothetical protein
MGKITTNEKRISDLKCDIWCMEVDMHIRKVNTPEGNTSTEFTDRDFFALGRAKRELKRLSK